MINFRHKGNDYIHVKNGWCIRQLHNSKRQLTWRVFWGPLIKNQDRPSYLNAECLGDAYLDFPNKTKAIERITNDLSKTRGYNA